MHLQGSLHLQLLGTWDPFAWCTTHQWLEGVHLSNWQVLGSVACEMGGSTHLSSSASGMFPCRAQGGDDWQAEPSCHRAKWSGRDRPKMSAEMERIFSSNSVRSSQTDAKDRGPEGWGGVGRVGQWEQLGQSPEVGIRLAVEKSSETHGGVRQMLGEPDDRAGGGFLADVLNLLCKMPSYTLGSSVQLR